MNKYNPDSTYGGGHNIGEMEENLKKNTVCDFDALVFGEQKRLLLLKTSNDKLLLAEPDNFIEGYYNEHINPVLPRIAQDLVTHMGPGWMIAPAQWDPYNDGQTFRIMELMPPPGITENALREGLEKAAKIVNNEYEKQYNAVKGQIDAAMPAIVKSFEGSADAVGREGYYIYYSDKLEKRDMELTPSDKKDIASALTRRRIMEEMGCERTSPTGMVESLLRYCLKPLPADKTPEQVLDDGLDSGFFMPQEKYDALIKCMVSAIEKNLGEQEQNRTREAEQQTAIVMRRILQEAEEQGIPVDKRLQGIVQDNLMRHCMSRPVQPPAAGVEM